MRKQSYVALAFWALLAVAPCVAFAQRTGDPMRDVDVSLGRKPPGTMPKRDGGVSYESLMGSIPLWVGGQISDLEATLQERPGRSYDYQLPDLKAASSAAIEEIRIYRLKVNAPCELEVVPGAKGGHIMFSAQRRNIDAALQVGIAGGAIQVMSLTYHGLNSNGPSWGSGWRNLGGLWSQDQLGQGFTQVYEGSAKEPTLPAWVGCLRTAVEAKLYTGLENPTKEGGVMAAFGNRETPSGKQPWLQVGYCGPIVMGGEGKGGTDSYPRRLWWPEEKQGDDLNYLYAWVPSSGYVEPLLASTVPGIDVIVKKPPGNAFVGASGATLVGKLSPERAKAVAVAYLREGKAGICGMAHYRPSTK